MKRLCNMRRAIAGAVAAAMITVALPVLPVAAEESETAASHTNAMQEKETFYPYTIFAASGKEGAITLDASNICVNGSLAANGTITINGSRNINGKKTEHAEEPMPGLAQMLEETYFTGRETGHEYRDYYKRDVNIQVKTPLQVTGELTLNGNTTLEAAVRATGTITLNGENHNANHTAVCSENGDIFIKGGNVSISGLLYAPHGGINITAQNLNLNNCILIGDTVTLRGSNINAGYNQTLAKQIGNDWKTETTEPEKPGTEEPDPGKPGTEDPDPDRPGTEDPDPGKPGTEEPDLLTDTDKDGLPDYYEEMLGTDKTKTDTDGDGLPDGFELFDAQTSPTQYDSVQEGVSDGEADLDGDSLTNAQEWKLGTDPLCEDTDGDGLADADEDTLYGTNPLLKDTDGDGVADGDELQIGLDPLNPQTFGVPDGEYQLKQQIAADSSALAAVNTPESPYQLSFAITASGYVEGNLEAQESAYTKALQNDAMLGIAPELTYTEALPIEEVTLQFRIAEEYTDNTLNLFPGEEEFSGLKRLNVFKYFEDLNMLLPIETQYDLEHNIISAKTDELGTYCVMDLEIWFQGFGVSGEEYQDTPAVMSLPEAEAVAGEGSLLYGTVEDNPLLYGAGEELPEGISGNDPAAAGLSEEVSGNDPVTAEFSKDISGNEPAALDWQGGFFAAEREQGTVLDRDALMLEQMPMTMSPEKSGGAENPIDLVFILQTAGNRYDLFTSQKDAIVKVMQSLNQKYSGVRVCVITYGLKEAQILTDEDAGIWFTDADDLKEKLQETTWQYTYEYVLRDQAFYKLLNEVTFRAYSAKFAVQFLNGNHQIHKNYFDELYMAKKYVINYSEFGPAGFSYFGEFEQMISNYIAGMNGLRKSFDSATAADVVAHICKYARYTPRPFDIITPTGWRHIVLADTLSPDNGTDTDGDSLTDWEEVDTRYISWDKEGKLVLPTLKECMDATDCVYAQHWAKRFSVQKHGAGYRYQTYLLSNVRVLPILSDPTDKDSDDDTLDDARDPERFHYNRYMEFGSKEYFEDLRRRAGSNDNAEHMRDLMMEDINNTEMHELVSDEHWDAFCEYFNECVIVVSILDIDKTEVIPKELHYFRNKLNRAPITLDELMLEADKWTLCEVEDSLYHMNGENGAYNMKFVSICGKYEAVYNKDGELLTEYNDAVNMGTYNYYSYHENRMVHGIYDVVPYLDWGNTPDAPKPQAVNEKDVRSDREAMAQREEIVIEFNESQHRISKNT